LQKSSAEISRPSVLSIARSLVSGPNESDWLPAWWPTEGVPRVMEYYSPPDSWDAERVLEAMRD
jgi:hypothetical protein